MAAVHHLSVLFPRDMPPQSELLSDDPRQESFQKRKLTTGTFLEVVPKNGASKKKTRRLY